MCAIHVVHPNISVYVRSLHLSLLLLLLLLLLDHLHVRRGHGAQHGFSEHLNVDRHVGHRFAAYGSGEAAWYSCLQLQESIQRVGLILIPLVTDKLTNASSLWKKSNVVMSANGHAKIRNDS